MNYEKIYNTLIKNRTISPVVNGYCENHHILPRSMSGSNDPSNLVKLTGREHWIAHLLLHKIHRLPQTAHACHMMAMRCEERGIPRIKNSRMYQHVRESLIPLWSKNGKKQAGKNHASYGTMWICNIGLKENKKIKKDEPIPEGWIAGRNGWKCSYEKQKQRQRAKYAEFRKNNPKLTKQQLHEIYSKAGKIRAAKTPLTIGKGTIWINDGVSIDKRILKTENIPYGWKRGRLKGDFRSKSR